MRRLARILTTVPLAAFVAGTCLLMAWTNPAAASDDELPAPVAALADRGLDIIDTFDAPSGLTGYAATFRGRPLAIYLTADGKHAILGTLVDAQGRDMSAGPLARAASGPRAENAWAQLESSHWVRDGSKDADVIVYEFTDPNCPYCHRFWQTARPWVEAGKVQIRHALVGILAPSSGPKAATILAADDPSAAFERNEENYDRGGVQALDDIPVRARRKVAANNQLMSSLGYFGTPTIVYKTPNGEVSVKQGVPQGGEVEKILGGPKP